MKQKITQKMNPKQEAHRKIMAIQRALFERASRTNVFSKQINAAYKRYTRMLVGFVLVHELSIRDSEITKKVFLAISTRTNHLDAMLAEIKKQKPNSLAVSHDARAEQRKAKQREAICGILGKEKGALFWERFTRLRSEGYGKNNQGG